MPEQIEYAVVLVQVGKCPELYQKIKPSFDIAKGAYATELSLITGEKELNYRIEKDDPEGTIYCLAVDKQDNVLGFILLESEDRTRTLWTCHVYVRPEVRRQGVYHRMMDRVMKFAKDCKFNRVFAMVHIDNRVSQHTHHKTGFKKRWYGYEIDLENEE